MRWPVVPLKRLVLPARPITYGIVQAGEDVADGVPYIRPVDMTESAGIRPGVTLRRTAPEIARNYSRSTVRAGDLVMSIGPSFGKIMTIPPSLSGANLTQGTARIAPAQGVDARFLFWALQARTSVSYWESAVGGATFRALNLGPLADTPVARPPVEEQQRIANFLDAETARIDRLVVLRNKQEALAEEALTATLRRLTTLGEACPSTRSTGVEWMPEMAQEWRLHKVGRVMRTGSGTTPKADQGDYYSDDGTPWVNTGDLRDEIVSSAARFVTPQARDDYPTLRVYAPGTLLVAMYGATIGRLGVLGIWACVNQACCALLAGGPLSLDYAFAWFLAYREEIVKLGAGGGQPNISQELIRSLRIPAPDLVEQARLVRLIDAARSQVRTSSDLLLRSAALLRERRQAVITAAVTGQFDVSTAGRAA